MAWSMLTDWLGALATVILIALYIMALRWASRPKRNGVLTFEQGDEFVNKRVDPIKMVTNWAVTFDVESEKPYGLPVLDFILTEDGDDLLSGIPQLLPHHDPDMQRRWQPKFGAGKKRFVLCHIEQGHGGEPGKRLLIDLERLDQPIVTSRIGHPDIPGTTLPNGDYLIGLSIPALALSEVYRLEWHGDITTFKLRRASRKEKARRGL